MTTAAVNEPAWKSRYGPQQLRDLLGLTEWQHERGSMSRVIPPPDAAGGKWSREVARGLWLRRVAIRRHAGGVPDVGSVRAAEYLTARLGIEVFPEALAELARQGLILVVGSLEKYHGSYPLYCGRTLETWPVDDRETVERANVAGELLVTDRVVDRLGVRRSDVDHLVRLRWLVPVEWGRGPHTPRSASPDVPLYRAGDVTALLLCEQIDWDAVRAVGKGQRSPLASLPARP